MGIYITTDQQEEIAKLANEGHRKALVAYGADMYSDGIRKGYSDAIYTGAITVTAGVIIGFIIKSTVNIVKNYKKKKSQEN